MDEFVSVSEYRMIFMAMPPLAVRSEMQRALVEHGLAARLGRAMFAPENWHQSLAGRFDGGLVLRDRLLRVGSRIDATAFTMTLNRLRGEHAAGAAAHWAFHAHGRPPGLMALQAAVRQALAGEGQVVEGGHSGHVTISYRAPGPLPTVKITPIAWTIDEVLLVHAGGLPYRYDVLGRWPLRPAPRPALVGEQQGLWD